MPPPSLGVVPRLQSIESLAVKKGSLLSQTARVMDSVNFAIEF